jgi:hypothetical protein
LGRANAENLAALSVVRGISTGVRMDHLHKGIVSPSSQ